MTLSVRKMRRACSCHHRPVNDCRTKKPNAPLERLDKLDLLCVMSRRCSIEMLHWDHGVLVHTAERMLTVRRTFPHLCLPDPETQRRLHLQGLKARQH